MAKYNKIQVLDAMMSTGIVPVFYNADLEVSKNVLKACYEGGIRAFEFANRGDSPTKCSASWSNTQTASSPV